MPHSQRLRSLLQLVNNARPSPVNRYSTTHLHPSNPHPSSPSPTSSATAALALRAPIAPRSVLRRSELIERTICYPLAKTHLDSLSTRAYTTKPAAITSADNGSNLFLSDQSELEMSDPTPPTSANKRPASPTETDQSSKRHKEDVAPPAAEAEAKAEPGVKESPAGEKTAQTGTKASSNGAAQASLPKKMDDVNMDGSAAGPSSASTIQSSASLPSAPVAAEAPPQQIAMRCLIVTQDASIIIGRGGAHVNEIREKSSARVTVSEVIPGNPERILNVSGALDAVAKAFGLIVRRINDEPFDVASVPGSRAVTIKFIIPNTRMGSVIGKGGAKIKEIQEASGARLNASDTMLPGSTERVLSVSGVADAVHIAVYYIGTILLEFQEKHPGTAAGGAYRQQGARNGPPSHGPSNGGPSYSAAAPPPGAQTQQIFIPNALVGAIIGKGGVKINEIRAQSQCQIRVMDPGTPASPGQAPNPEERLVTITGAPGAINHAVSLLYARLEQEKNKATGPPGPRY